jgi:hypothetical protein
MKEVIQRMDGRKTYHVINRFSHHLEGNPDASIDTRTQRYFDLGSKRRPEIVSPDFYKMWELIVLFSLVPSTGKFNSLHLAESSASSIQAVALFRDKFAKSSKGDIHYSAAPHSERASVSEAESKFMNHYSDRVTMHKTVPSDRVTKGRDNGDLTMPETILNIASENPGTAELVIADGALEWRNENQQEQEAFMLILGEILTALHCQKAGGNFAIRFYESFTTTSIKMLALLTEAWSDVHVIKPMMSHDSNSERYIVCLNFRLSEDRRKRLCKRLIELLVEWRKSGLQAHDIFADFEIPESLWPTIRAINTQIANRQLIAINKMVLYVRENDLYGRMYQEALARQVTSSNFWVSTFYRDDPSEIRKYMVDLQESLGKSRTLLLGNDA